MTESQKASIFINVSMEKAVFTFDPRPGASQESESKKHQGT